LWASLAWPLWAAAQTPTDQDRSTASAISLPKQAAQPESFVPGGWALERKLTADLNRDGRPDALLLMRREGGVGTPQRIVAVVLRAPDTRGYRLAEANDQIIPHPEDTSQEDPMADGEIVVRTGGFDLKLTLFSGVGSYLTATVRYRFRRQNGCYRLIKFDRLETHRATLDTRDLSVNFLTGKVIRRTGNAQSDATQESTDRLNANPRRCLADLGSAATFDPL